MQIADRQLNGFARAAARTSTSLAAIVAKATLYRHFVLVEALQTEQARSGAGLLPNWRSTLIRPETGTALSHAATTSFRV